MDKAETALWTIRAYLHLQFEEQADAIRCLEHAREVARQFGADPNYSGSRLRFVSDDTVASSFDDLGQTAMEGITKVISDFDSDELFTLWEKIQNEKPSKNI